MTTWHRLILHPQQTEAMPGSLKFDWMAARASVGNDPSFAAFRTTHPDNELYFSPAAITFATSVGAKPCGAPRRDSLALCHSDARAWDLCFP